MAESRVVELESKCLTDEDETCFSDDLDVSVANMNRGNERGIPTAELNEEDSSVIDGLEDDDEEVIVSDEDYNYSEDSVCSESEMTNVTARSSLRNGGSPPLGDRYLGYPINRNENRRPDEERRRRFSSVDGPEKRTCSSVSAKLYPNRGNAPRRFESAHPRPGRRNMSFTNAEMQRIETENQYLLRKIMAQQRPRGKQARTQSAQPRIASSAINRRNLQKRIDEENMMLLRRIQGSKSCAASSTVIPGYRLTSL